VAAEAEDASALAQPDTRGEQARQLRVETRAVIVVVAPEGLAREALPAGLAREPWDGMGAAERAVEALANVEPGRWVKVLGAATIRAARRLKHPGILLRDPVGGLQEDGLVPTVVVAVGSGENLGGNCT
jgi:hypothetical protein